MPRMHSFIDWIEYQATIDPTIALELCESLLFKLQSFETKSRFWHSKPLISTLTTILREAGEMDVDTNQSSCKSARSVLIDGY